MAHTKNNIEALVGSQEAFEQMVQERLRQAVRVALISVLEEEVTAFIGAQPYERNKHRRDQRNGHYTRNLETTMGLIPDLPVPRTRGGHQTQVFERYHRRRDELDTAIGQMFVDEVSEEERSALPLVLARTPLKYARHLLLRGSAADQRAVAMAEAPDLEWALSIAKLPGPWRDAFR